MAFINAQKSRCLVGSLGLSGFAKSFGFNADVDMIDVTVIANTAKAFIVGQDTSTFSAELVLDTDTTAGGLHAVLTAWKSAAATPITYAPSGLTALSEAFLIGALETSFTPSAAVGGAVMASISAQTDGQSDAGFVIEDATAITITGNGTARDLTAQSTTGAVAHLHVSAFSGLTNDIVTIEDSADGSAGWATIGTFATVTGLTSQRLAIAGTVKRYVRVVDTATGTGSTTRAVSFARR